MWPWEGSPHPHSQYRQQGLFLLPHLPAHLPSPSAPNRSDSDLLHGEMVVVGRLDVEWLRAQGERCFRRFIQGRAEN